MAKKVYEVTEMTDDLDGSKGDVTVGFAIGGVNYEVDLSKRNKAAFDRALKPYVEAARRVRPPARPARRVKSREDLQEIREWALANGHTVSSRGRIAKEVQNAYDASR